MSNVRRFKSHVNTRIYKYVLAGSEFVEDSEIRVTDTHTHILLSDAINISFVSCFFCL